MVLYISCHTCARYVLELPMFYSIMSFLNAYQIIITFIQTRAYRACLPALIVNGAPILLFVTALNFYSFFLYCAATA
ncbi:hypothetical protein A0H81_07330 [Grifola frondosa]|uniref:Uncharacterized protein n=1 Tax=Grifola frondosa TaxID=5627 RepID=A0A1C7M795_GRIFR|nr:hypothetical protein A0H81_07330 [Grifola frondosa]